MTPAHVRPLNVKALPRFIKDDRFILTERGRYGPRWFHRLIWHCARKCGMLRHNIMEEVRVARIDLDGESLLKAAMPQIDMLLYANFHRNDLVIVAGNEKWLDLLASPEGWNIAISNITIKRGQIRDGIREERVFDILAYIVPHIEGVIVLPRSVFR